MSTHNLYAAECWYKKLYSQFFLVMLTTMAATQLPCWLYRYVQYRCKVYNSLYCIPWYWPYFCTHSLSVVKWRQMKQKLLRQFVTYVTLIYYRSYCILGRVHFPTLCNQFISIRRYLIFSALDLFVSDYSVKIQC